MRLLPFFALPAFFALACGTSPTGVDSCKKIEQARCENAPSCGIDLSIPAHRGSSPELNVASCIRYYDDACNHGLVVQTDPGNAAAQSCVDAINAGDCNVVKNPQTHASCAFLGVATTADASTP